MLRTRLFVGFMLVVLLFAALSAVLVIRTIATHVIAEAQNRVRLDLSSAWSVYDSKKNQTEMIINLVADKQMVVEACEKGNWSDPNLAKHLHDLRSKFGLDFMGIVDPDGDGH